MEGMMPIRRPYYRERNFVRGTPRLGSGERFEKLQVSIAKNCEGKKVPLKYQKLYGKTYDKDEAKEVAAKIAAAIGRRRYGSKRFAQMSARARVRRL